MLSNVNSLARAAGVATVDPLVAFTASRFSRVPLLSATIAILRDRPHEFGGAASQIFAIWNRIGMWLRQLDELRRVALAGPRADMGQSCSLSDKPSGSCDEHACGPSILSSASSLSIAATYLNSSASPCHKSGRVRQLRCGLHACAP